MTVLSGSDAHDCDQTSSNGLCTIIGKSPYTLITGSVSANCQAVHATRSTFLCQLFSRYENVNSIIGLAVPLPYTIDTINDQRLWPPTQFCLILGQFQWFQRQKTIGIFLYNFSKPNNSDNACNLSGSVGRYTTYFLTTYVPCAEGLPFWEKFLISKICYDKDSTRFHMRTI